ncbi:hypothetical protein THIOKS1860009 [Thiocapsa sp. KS1]|nr:hypothetical protein THIOKS1860009 [Thiocapsa sp. KS1]
MEESKDLVHYSLSASAWTIVWSADGIREAPACASTQFGGGGMATCGGPNGWSRMGLGSTERSAA